MWFFSNLAGEEGLRIQRIKDASVPNTPFSIKSKSPEPVSKRFSLFKVKEGKNFNRRNILNISMIKI